MTGDVAAHVRSRHPCFPAERGSEDIIQVAFTDNRQAIQEENVNYLSSLRVWQLHPLWSALLPAGYAFPDYGINWLREGS